MRDTCEIKAFKQWHSITLEAALTTYARREFRCPECQGQIRAHKEGSSGVPRAHFEHLVANPGCSLGNCFSGTPARHLRPLA